MVLAMDDYTIRLTPFSFSVMPPPMSYDEVQLKHPPLAFAVDENVVGVIVENPAPSESLYNVQLYTLTLKDGNRCNGF